MPLRHPMPARPRRSAFTLIEVLVVMGIIVLLIALALPAFSFITGSRSTQAAANQISAALGVARANAVGLQKVCGVMFFIEPSSENVQIALVQGTDRPTPDTDAGEANISVYLDRAADTEFAKLPVGVGVQTVTNALTGVPANRDRYIGFNRAGIGSNGANQPNLTTRIGGVILFDGNGQLIARTYAFRSRANGGAANGMGAMLFYDADPTQADMNSSTNTPRDYIPSATLATAPVSQLGFVLFDSSVFESRFQSATVQDPTSDTRANITANPQADETLEEAWLDENGTPTMINRYNGTLVRGE